MKGWQRPTIQPGSIPAHSIILMMGLALAIGVSGCQKSRLSKSAANPATVLAMAKDSSTTSQGAEKPAGACFLPWGGWTATGTSVDAYNAGTLSCFDDKGDRQFCSTNNSTHHITRTCTNGVLSGDAAYSYGNCYESACASCGVTINASLITLQNNDALNFFPQGSVACGSTCQPSKFTCINGDLKNAAGDLWSAGSFPATSCSTVPCSCTAPDPVTHQQVTYPSGATAKFWDQKAPGCGDTCGAHNVTLTCNNGKWAPDGFTGTAVAATTPPADAIIGVNGNTYFNSCTPVACSSCTLPWTPNNQVADYRDASHPAPITAFDSSAPNCPTACASTQLRCANGTWTKLDGGSYAGGLFKDCGCQCAVNLHGGTTAHILKTQTHNFWTGPNLECGALASTRQVSATCTAESGLTLSGADTNVADSTNWYDFGNGMPPIPPSGCTCRSLDLADTRQLSSNGHTVPVTGGVSTYNHGDQQVFFTKSNIHCGRTNNCAYSGNHTTFTCTSGSWTGGDKTATWHASCTDQACNNCSSNGLSGLQDTAFLTDYQDSSNPAPATLHKSAYPACPGSCLDAGDSAPVRCNDGSLEYQSAGVWNPNNSLYISGTCGTCQCKINTRDQNVVSILQNQSRNFFDTGAIACLDVAPHTFSASCTSAGLSGLPAAPAGGWYGGPPNPPACTCTLPNNQTVAAGTGTLFTAGTPSCQNNCDTLGKNYICKPDMSMGGTYQLFESNGTTHLDTATYGKKTCQYAGPCNCTTPGNGPMLNIGNTITLSFKPTLPCGTPCSTVSTVAKCDYNASGAPALFDQSGGGLLSNIYIYAGCQNTGCAVADQNPPAISNNQAPKSGGDGGGGGGGQGTGNGRGRGDQDLEIGFGGGGPGDGLEGCDPIASNDSRFNTLHVNTVESIVVNNPDLMAFKKCQLPWINQAPAGQANFSMGGLLTSGTQITAFTQSTVSGSQTCESVRVPIYCDSLGVLYVYSPNSSGQNLAGTITGSSGGGSGGGIGGGGSGASPVPAFVYPTLYPSCKKAGP